MLSKDTFEFFIQLKENNNRDWFQKNKKLYENARKDFEHFVTHLIDEVLKFDSNIGMMEAKNTIYRIYRDVRFSKDKSPYKTNMGSHIVKGGKKSGNAGYYFHFEPGGSFVGGGVWQPMPDKLKVVRNEVYQNIEEFLAIIEEKSFADYFGELQGDKLVNPPKGFPLDFEYIDLLKFKSYTVWKPIPDKIVNSEKLLSEVAGGFKLMKPLIDFINYGFQES